MGLSVMRPPMVRVVLLLLVPFLLSQMGACQEETNLSKVDFGPAVDPTLIDRALTEPATQNDPLTIKRGEGFVFSETQEIVGSGGTMVVSDTSRTVIELRDQPIENPTERLLTVIEHKQFYSNGDVRKVSTEIPLRIELKPNEAIPQGMAEKIMVGPHVANDLGFTHRIRPEIQKLLKDFDFRPTAVSPSTSSSTESAGSMESQNLQSQAEEITYHRLKAAWRTQAPPTAVQSQPNCGGVPQCQIRVYAVSFDMVFWDQGKPDRVHWEVELSPDTPFLASLINKCVTSLVSVGSGQSKILVKQCLPVVNFRFQ